MNILKIYTKLYDYSKDDDKSVALVISKIDSQLYIQKEMRNCDPEIFQFFKDHPVCNIPRIYHVIPQENRLIIIKEFIHMTTLEEYALNYPLDLIEIRRIILKISEILHRLHHLPEPIIHCDLNLTNVFYNGKELYLNDFDIAKLYSKHEIITMGSKGYAPPEQYERHSADFQNDIYALGMIYSNLLKMNSFNQNEDFNIIEMMCEKNKQKRIHSIDEVITILNELI